MTMYDNHYLSSYVIALPHSNCALSLYPGGGGEAEATLSDVQLSRIAGPDIFCQL